MNIQLPDLSEYENKSIVKNELSYGFHVSKRSSIFDTVKFVSSTQLTAFQMYLWNPHQYCKLNPDPNDLIQSRYLIENYKLKVYVHASLINNPAGSANSYDDPKYNQKLFGTRSGLLREVDISATIGAGVVLHIGHQKDKQLGYHTIIETLNQNLAANDNFTLNLAYQTGLSLDHLRSKRKICLENASGKGSVIGTTLEDIAIIRSGICPTFKDQVKVCIDTAHSYGAGQFDFGQISHIDAFYQEYCNQIGINSLELFHLNDSLAQWNSKGDLHGNLRNGYIFNKEGAIDALKVFLDRANSLDLAIIGEPPDPGYPNDFNLVKSLSY